MSVLLVDIGNTRVKWAHLENGRLRSQQAAAYGNWGAKEFSRALFFPARRAERIFVASVAEARVNRAFSAAARRHCSVAPEFFKTQRHAAGITTKYRDPWRLGVDRFVAVIGAHHLIPNHAVCVVDIGTAMTIDLVDARGVHHGGAIIPGPDLMAASLLKETSGIERRAAGAPAAGRTLFARNTRAAIQRGALHAVSAAIDGAVEEARRILGEKPRLVLTGGAAQPVRRLIQTKHRWVPDLVLRGLAVAYHSSSRPGEVHL